MATLHLEDLRIGYGGRPVIQGLDLRVAEGEMVSLLGPSGAGKTTILRAVAGLIRPDSGEIRMDGQPVTRLPAERRDVVMVFQKPLLFPYLNVAQNIAFGLRMRKVPGREIAKRVARILDLVRMPDFETRRVHELSGGQQQRVSLARALVLKPGMLLLDEPLSHLDAALRQEMRELIREIQAETRITTLFVTHDQTEALTLSHRVGLILRGRLHQVGTPREIFHQPADPDVARFFGGCNFFQGTLRQGRFECPLGRFPAPGITGNGHGLTATIRPEDIRVRRDPERGVAGVIEKSIFEGVHTRVWLNCGGIRLIALSGDPDLALGAAVSLHLPPEKVRVFPPSPFSPEEEPS